MTCENAYLQKNKYYCRVIEHLCPNVYFCDMRGKWELNENVQKCPKRKEGKSNG